MIAETRYYQVTALQEVVAEDQATTIGESDRTVARGTRKRTRTTDIGVITTSPRGVEIFKDLGYDLEIRGPEGGNYELRAVVDNERLEGRFSHMSDGTIQALTGQIYIPGQITEDGARSLIKS